MPVIPHADVCACQQWRGTEPACVGCEAVERGYFLAAKRPSLELGDSWLCCHVGKAMPYFREDAAPYVQAFVRMSCPIEARRLIARGFEEPQYRETQRAILWFAMEHLIK